MDKQCTKCFISGAAFGVCLLGLYQDYLGLDAYLNFVRNEWLHINWLLWLPIMLLPAGSLAYSIWVVKVRDRTTQAYIKHLKHQIKETNQ